MTKSRIAIAGLEPENDHLASLSTALELQLITLSEQVEKRDDPARCLVVNWEHAETRETWLDARNGGKLPVLPTVIIVDDPWSDAVNQAFAQGIDDFVIASDLTTLETKLASLLREGGLPSTQAAGKVVLADPDRNQRVLFAGQLRRMGFNVEFAVDEMGIPHDESVKLVVASCALDVVAALEAAPDSRPPWLVTGSKDELLGLDLDKMERIKLFDTSSEPAQLVFTANQLLTEGFQQMRRSKRLPYGTAVLFHIVEAPSANVPAEATRPIFGYTYNISEGGLFVRTMTPPGLATHVELEFSPPHGKGRVCVQGQVAWREARPVNPRGVPCGFGLQYTDLPVADGAALNAGYAALLDEDSLC
jgi:hypothetical protein